MFFNFMIIVCYQITNVNKKKMHEKPRNPEQFNQIPNAKGW
jgi:hypothetical protein